MRGLLIAVIVCLAFFGFGFQTNILAEDVIPCFDEPTDQTIQYGNFLDGPYCQISVGDIDIFRFDGRQNEKIIVQATDQSGYPYTPVVCITLLDPDGIPTPVGEKKCANLTARIDEILEKDGIYTILVEEGGGRAMPYGLAVERLAPTFPPDSPLHCMGCNISDGIDGIGDLDLFVFDGRATDQIIVQGTDKSGYPYSPYACITLYGPDGMPTINGDRRCANLTARIDETLELDGVHAILVEEGTGQTMPYSTDIQCIVGPSCGQPPPTCGGQDATIIGTEGDNVIIGTEEDDVIVGLGGNDIIYGLDGSDTICGGDGDDVLLGGEGWDTILGEKGNDVIWGEGGRDFLFGGGGNDTLDGGSYFDKLDGGWGNDTLYGSVGDDELIGNQGVDVCDGGPHRTGDTADNTCEITVNVEMLP